MVGVRPLVAGAGVGVRVTVASIRRGPLATKKMCWPHLCREILLLVRTIMRELCRKPS